MFSVEFKGHEYGASLPIDARLCWYQYSPSNGATSVNSTGSHTSTVYKSSDNYVVIRVTMGSGYYTSYIWNQYTTAQGLYAFGIQGAQYNNTATHYA
jgi:hypothetical protein